MYSCRLYSRNRTVALSDGIYSIGQKKVHCPSRLAPQIQIDSPAILPDSPASVGNICCGSFLGTISPNIAGDACHHLLSIHHPLPPHHPVRIFPLLFRSSHIRWILSPRTAAWRICTCLDVDCAGGYSHDPRQSFMIRGKTKEVSSFERGD